MTSRPDYGELRRRYRDRLDALLVDTEADGEIEDELDGLDAVDALEEAAVDSARVIDPAASSLALLDVRLLGSLIEPGTVDTEMYKDIMPHLEAEIRAVMPNAEASEVKLRLAGLSSGSVVLHMRPDIPDAGDDDTDGLIGNDGDGPVDGAIRSVLNAHSSFESGAPGGEIARQHARVLPEFSKLTKALDKYDLTLDLSWNSSNGRRRRARLSRAGRQHAARLFEQMPNSEIAVVAGYVHQLSMTGYVVLKANPSVRTSRTTQVVIEPERLAYTDLTLGRYVRLRVNATFSIDKVGQSTEPKYSFLDMLPREEFALDDDV